MQKEIRDGCQAGKKLKTPSQESARLTNAHSTHGFTNDDPLPPPDLPASNTPTQNETTHSVVRVRGVTCRGPDSTNCVSKVALTEDLDVGIDDPLVEHLSRYDDDLAIPDHLVKSGQSRAELPAFPLFIEGRADDPSCIRPRESRCFGDRWPKEADIYRRVISVNRPNYRGARVPVKHQLNIVKWEEHRHLLPDTTLMDILNYGFPTGYTGAEPPSANLQNHSSATRNPSHVEGYIETEMAHDALLGPFPEAPFDEWFRTNPVMTRPKKDSTDLRVILDLSFPDGTSVNHTIPQHTLDSSDFKLQLPTPDLLANKIIQLGQGCLLYKIDLSRAYRQLRSDPRDWPLLGIRWGDQIYIDTAIPFGLRHGASACQRTSEAVVTIANDLYGTWALPYIDDTAGRPIRRKHSSTTQAYVTPWSRWGYILPIINASHQLRPWTGLACISTQIECQCTSPPTRSVRLPNYVLCLCKLCRPLRRSYSHSWARSCTPSNVPCPHAASHHASSTCWEGLSQEKPSQLHTRLRWISCRSRLSWHDSTVVRWLNRWPPRWWHTSMPACRDWRSLSRLRLLCSRVVQHLQGVCF